MPRRTIATRPNYTARPGEAVWVSRDGDGSFAIGLGRITIASDDIVFVNDVVADVGRLAYSVEGEAVLCEGDRLAVTIRIEPPDPPTVPPNGWMIPSGKGAQRGGSTIVYDPADWPRRGDPRSPSSVEILLLLLRQANTNGAGKSDPSKPGWGGGRGVPSGER